MKRIVPPHKTYLLFIVCLFSGNSGFSQPCDCPIKGGYFKDFSLLMFSHHDPSRGTVILSQ